MSTHSPIIEFLNYLLNRAAVQRVIFIGCDPVKYWAGSEQPHELIHLGKSDKTSGESNEERLDLKITFLATDLEQPFLIEETILQDAVVVCLDAFDQLNNTAPLNAALAHARLRCKYMLITVADRIRTFGFTFSESSENRCPHLKWSAEEFFQTLVKAGFPQSMLFGFTSGSSNVEQKNSILVITGREVEPSITCDNFRVAAVINVFNEIDVINTTIRYLADQGIEVHIVDNWSDDGTFELCQSLMQQNLVSNLLRFPEQKTNDYEWAKQLEHTAKYAAQLNADWVIHYDADEIRCSPWQNVTLLGAIKFVDSLSYTAIDFTVLDFRFIDEIDKDFSPDEFHYFEFGRHLPNFMQIKAWKNWGQTVDLITHGGHEAIFDGQKVYPLKFLTKHFSLRNKRQATKKIFSERIPRITKERAERGWHGHLDPYKYLSTIEPWTTHELTFYDGITFQHEFLLERLSGIGISQENHTTLNKNSSTHLGLVVEEIASQLDTLDQGVAKRDGQIASLNQAVAERDGQIDAYHKAMLGRDEQIASLNQAMAERDKTVTTLNMEKTALDKEVTLIKSTASWHITAPLRAAWNLYRRLFD